MERFSPTVEVCAARPAQPRTVFWLQGITTVWMFAECAVSLYAASTAHSVALLTFGADGLVELLSAIVVLLSFIPSLPIARDRAARWSGILLFVLAGVIAVTAVVTLMRGNRPESSCAGIGITIAALFVMPILAWLKRRTARETGSRALAADAVQSATCAYLAALTLAGLAINMLWHIHWVDATAALLALPILILEGRRALRGESCGCC